MQREQKRLIYKLANGTGDQTLQAALSKSIRRYSKPEKRLEAMGADEAEVRFIAYVRTNQGMYQGVFHKLTRGKAQEVIQMIRGGDEWPVHQVKATADEEFIEGTLFFGIWKNNVIVHQANACRADSFQEHLSWLLSRADEVEAGDNDGVSNATLIELADPIPPSARSKSKVPVKEIMIGGAVATRVVHPKSASTGTEASGSFSPTGRIWRAVKDIFSELQVKVPDDLLLNESLGENDLRVSLRLSCTKQKSETTAGHLLGVLGHALSHAESSSYKLTLADNTEITGDAMKVRDNVSVECVDHHPVHQSMFGRIHEYMTALIQNGTILDDEPFGNLK